MRVERPDVAEAVDRYVGGGAGKTVWIGNFGAQLFAVGHALVRQRKAGLHVVMASGGILLDQLLGAGVVAEATFAHCWSPVGPEPAWNFRRLHEARNPTDGPPGSTAHPAIRWHELSIGLLEAALTAAAWRVPFLPVSLHPGSGYLTEDWTGGMLGRVDGPFGTATVVRALPLDVAFVHAALADDLGNAAVGAPHGEALAAAGAARHVVVVAESIATTEQVAAAGITLPGVAVDAVVHAPGAVRPDGVAGRYERDTAACRSYTAAATTAGGMAAWVRELTEVRG